MKFIGNKTYHTILLDKLDIQVLRVYNNNSQSYCDCQDAENSINSANFLIYFEYNLIKQYVYNTSHESMLSDLLYFSVCCVVCDMSLCETNIGLTPEN